MRTGYMMIDPYTFKERVQGLILSPNLFAWFEFFYQIASQQGFESL
jgi:hypothetical protein